tara:strand:+ start:53 stop:487 length:435 start_codon:yes stop_codon:yes gene_type:complete
MDLNGDWQGIIIYGNGPKKIRGQKLFFEAQIKQQKQTFTGLAKDTVGLGIHPEPAKLEGEINGNQISFTKQYPSFHYVGKKESVKFEESLKGPKIKYFGSIDTELETIEGVWEMKSKWYIFGLFPSTSKQYGTWSLKRKIAGNT